MDFENYIQKHNEMIEKKKQLDREHEKKIGELPKEKLGEIEESEIENQIHIVLKNLFRIKKGFEFKKTRTPEKGVIIKKEDGIHQIAYRPYNKHKPRSVTFTRGMLNTGYTEQILSLLEDTQAEKMIKEIRQKMKELKKEIIREKVLSRITLGKPEKIYKEKKWGKKYEKSYLTGAKLTYKKHKYSKYETKILYKERPESKREMEMNVEGLVLLQEPVQKVLQKMLEKGEEEIQKLQKKTQEKHREINKIISKYEYDKLIALDKL